MSQASLFDTRRAAKAAIDPHAPTMEARVLAFIRDRSSYGGTDQEVADELGMLPDTARARRCDLEKAGQVHDSGVTRPSKHGGPHPRPCVVWVATPHTVNPNVRAAGDDGGHHHTSPQACRCGSQKFLDVRIHGGQSIRRDCARCSRTVGFPIWYGRPANR